MAANYTTAIDEILGLFKAAWDAGAGTFNGGTVPEVRYDGIGEAGPPDGEAPWAKVTIRHGSSPQGSLSSGAGLVRYENGGTITVQVRYPLKSGGLNDNAKGLAEVARAAFRGKATASQVWFRNARINEVGAVDAYYLINVNVEFLYDELVS
jgi:hypothetical protein